MTEPIDDNVIQLAKVTGDSKHWDAMDCLRNVFETMPERDRKRILVVTFGEDDTCDVHIAGLSRMEFNGVILEMYKAVMRD